MRKSLMAYFVEPYSSKPLLYRKKAEYTVVLSILVLLIILIECPIRILTEGFHSATLVEALIVSLAFLLTFLLIRRARIELAVNLMVAMGLLQAVVLALGNRDQEFFPLCMLIIISAAVCNVRRYQVHTVSLGIGAIAAWKLGMGLHDLEAGLSSAAEFGSLLFAFMLLCTFITFAHFLVEIVDHGIRNGARLEEIASHDSLTGAFNRRSFGDCVRAEIDRFVRYDQPFSLLMFDVDLFKDINDRLGHVSGDGVLVALADMVRLTIRKTDIFFRWGGDEFQVLVSGQAPSGAADLAERIRSRVETGDAEAPCHFTVSVGWASYKSGETIDSLLSRTDAALYTAKRTGRNRVCGENALPENPPSGTDED